MSQSPTPLAVMKMTLVRDTLLAEGLERLRDACCRPRWHVPVADLKERFLEPDLVVSSAGLGLGLRTGLNGQSCITGHFQRRSARPRLTTLPPLTMYPWQLDPPLPTTVTIDLTNHHRRTLSAPPGWEILQRNGQTFITPPGQATVSLDQAQFGMLRVLHSREQPDQHELSVSFLTLLRESCLAQRRADGMWHVPWSRHLLACLHGITGAELLIGARAVTRHPHFEHYASPSPADQRLGAVLEWPSVTALLLLDSFEPDDRPALWRKVDAHAQPVWILLQARPGSELSKIHRELRSRSARQCAVLSAKSRVVHKDECWSDAKWDSEQAGYETQIWRVDPPCRGPRSGTPLETVPIPVQSLLGDWEIYRYDFHWYDGPSASLLQWYQENQQDACRLTWTGIIAGTDGGVDWKNERMGAGYVTGTERAVETSFSASVGGPLSTLRAEAASLLQLLRDLSDQSSNPLLVFVDCLVLLDILQGWGRVEFHPHPDDIVHFDVIFPLLDELRRRSGPVLLVKVKSHTGCLLNERADEWADRGFHAETPEICPGPRKYGSVWLGVRPHVRASAAQLGKSLPRDSAPNHTLLHRAVRVNIRRAVGMRSTTFVRQLLHQPEGETIARCVARCRPAEYRVWVKMTADRYPVYSYLHRCGLAQSPHCLYCQAQDETLAHFTTICPRFREARTAGHNRVRAKLTLLLTKCLDAQWQLFEETPMRLTGLNLQTVSAACMVAAGRLPPGHHDDFVCVGNLQPDLVLVSQSLKRIGLLDLCRPFDSLSERLAAARQRKQCTYGPLVEALRSYSESGWQVLILPWVVGIRGMVDAKSALEILNFLQVPRKRRATIVEEVAIESVKALYSLHQVRYQAFKLNLSQAKTRSNISASGNRKTAADQQATFDTDDPNIRCDGKRRRSADDDYGETRLRWKKMASDARGGS